MMTAIAKSRTPTITQANVALQSSSPSHSASAIVRAKAPTIMAHIKSINDTAQYLSLTIRRNRNHRRCTRSGAFDAVPR